MPSPSRPGPRQLTRADLPADLTAEALRHVDFRTLRELAKRGNGVLDVDEQRQFDAALAELRRGTTSRVEQSLERSRRAGPGNLDPALRRSYERTQRRLAEQAERVQQQFPESFAETSGSGATRGPATADDQVGDPDLSPNVLENEVEETSETLDILERIASLQQQLLEHQQRQLLGETRGLFFAFLVSVAVIVAGVAPLVEAGPPDRLLIVVWTVATLGVAGVAYAIVRWAQGRR